MITIATVTSYLKHAAIDAGLRPYRFALVTGCPRSGTTALIRWLEKQERVSAFNESDVLSAAHRFLLAIDQKPPFRRHEDYLIRVLRRTVSHYYASAVRIFNHLVVDKVPLEPVALPDRQYAAFLGNVRRLFPDAKLLFMIRHPVPTVWSIIEKPWDSMRLSLEEGLEIWKANASIISAHQGDERTVLCRFEDLVGDPHKTSQEILRFLNVKPRSPFRPEGTAKVGFTPDQEQQILEATRAERTALGY